MNFNPLQYYKSFINTPAMQQMSGSPLGQLMQGRLNTVLPALSQEFTKGTINGQPYRPQVMFSGEMETPMAGGPLPSFLRSGQDPVGFNSSYPDTVARERFDIPALQSQKIGAGSDRHVYDLGNGNVLKIAKAARGLAQNESEGDMYAPVPQVVEQGKNYVVTQKMNPPNPLTKEFVNMIGNNAHNRFISDVMNPIVEHYQNAGNEDVANIATDLMNYDPMINDLARIRNWGTDQNGLPSLLDAGALNNGTLNQYRGTTNMNDPAFRQVVMQSRAAKKQFGDTDNNTMYGLGGLLGTGAALNALQLYQQRNKNKLTTK